VTPPLNHGFDWRIVQSTGVTHVPLNVPQGLRISLSGQEPEQCMLLRQTLTTTPGKLYRVKFEMTGSIPAVEWFVDGRPLSNDGSFEASAPFTDLQLVYKRPVGELRAEGSLDLRRVTLTGVAP
jgi:hypothetical protein